MSNEEDIREAVDEAKAPGTFNIISVLQNRNYPKTEVNVMLDDSLAFEASVVKEKIDAIDRAIGKNKMSQKQQDERESLINEKEALLDKMAACFYVVEISGISEGVREEAYAEAKKRYPIEYESSNNISELLSGDSKRVEKESPERDSLFTDFLWQKSIQKVTDPQGNVQTEFPFAAIKSMRNQFPISAILRINNAIEQMRSASATFVMETGEDFLAKP